RLPRRFVHREVEAAGKGADLLAHALPGGDEQGIDQPVRGEPRLPHHGAQPLAAPQPPRPLGGEGQTSPPSSSSPKKKVSEHFWEQNARPYWEIAHFKHVHLKQMGHFSSRW